MQNPGHGIKTGTKAAQVPSLLSIAEFLQQVVTHAVPGDWDPLKDEAGLNQRSGVEL